MAENTKIQWTDRTASPWHGCTKIAPGCDNCYAAAGALRNPKTLGVWGDDGVRVKSRSFIGKLYDWNRRAMKAGKTISVFPSICDPFEDRPELVPWREEMFDAIDQCPHVRLLLLTKRPENITSMWPVVDATTMSRNVKYGRAGSWRANIYLVTSVSEQATVDRNIPLLLQCRDLVPMLGVSAEPLLAPVDFTALDIDGGRTLLNSLTGELTDTKTSRRCGEIGALDWVIVGGECGPKARPCNLEWIRSIRDQCQAAGVPCFVKQLGANVQGVERCWRCGHFDLAPVDGGPPLCNGCDAVCNRLRDSKGGDPSEWSEDLVVRQFPQAYSHAL